MMLGAVALAVLLALAAEAAAGDDQFTKDKQECVPHLVGLFPCLSYVGGNTKTPTMECCTILKQVLPTSKKCFCLVVRYRNEPGLGIKIDANLTLGLPAVCHATPIYNCPAILHLAPNSPETKVFTDFYTAQNATTASGPSTAVPGKPMTHPIASDGGRLTRRLGAPAVIQGILLPLLFFLLS